MAVWDLVYGTDLWSAAVTKINNVIGSYNGLSGGAENQRKVKVNATDFNTGWCDPEGKINSGSSFNFGTIAIGDSKTIATPYHSYSNEGNAKIKAYSLATPANYVIGTITAIPDNQNITVSITKVAGSGTSTDCVVIPYWEENDNQYIVNQTTAIPNTIFGIVATPPNSTFNSLWASVSQYGNLTTVSGFLQVTATSSAFDKDILLASLDSAYAIENGNSGRVVTGTASVSVKRTYLGVTENYSSVGWIDNYGGFNAYGATSTTLYINFSETAPIATVAIGDVFSYNFSLTYISKAE